MKFLYALVLFITLTLAAAYADTLKPSDFDYGFKVSVPETESVYSFTLPAHFYGHIKKIDASDMIVFNADGDPVPFSLRRPAPESYRTSDNQSAPFFIIDEEPDNTSEADKKPVEIIIDLSYFPQTPAALRFIFNSGKEFNALVNVYVSSSDLNSWSVITDSVNIAQLRSSGNMIKRDTVELPPLPHSAKYLKIQSSKRIAAQAIKEIDVSFHPSPVYGKAERLAVESTYTPSANNGSAQYDTHGHYPVEWIHFDIPPSYLFPDFTISTRNNSGEPWQPLRYRVRIAHYPLDESVNGAGIRDSRNRFWQLTVDGALPAKNNSAVFYWRADELIFMAKGPGPYTVAYGNDNFTPSADILSASRALGNTEMRITAVSPDIKPAYIGVAKQNQAVQKKSPFNLKNILLLGATLLVVAALTLSAVRLIMDINRKNG